MVTMATPLASVVPLAVWLPSVKESVRPDSGAPVAVSLSRAVSVSGSLYSPLVGPVYVTVVAPEVHVTVT